LFIAHHHIRSPTPPRIPSSCVLPSPRRRRKRLDPDPGDMPRYDDRYGNTRLYVGILSSRTRSRDLEYLFSKYGRIREVELKRDYAFIEFNDPRDADDAQYNLDGREVDRSRR
ncbi:unnamed protein product, partial [Urochloa humidicola]